MTAPRPLHPLRIGDWLLDPAANELRRDAQAVRVPARLVDLLLRLAATPAQCVRRETLIDEVWQRREVNDEVLSRAIADLRQFLGDDARAPRYIETLPKLGYRLLAPVEMQRSAEAAIADATVVAPQDAPASEPTSLGVARHPRRRWRLALGACVTFAALAGVIAITARRDAATPGAGSAAPLPDPLTPDNLLRARPFTSEPGRELFPRFTPDARWVIYTRAANGADAGPAQLRLRAVDGTEDRALVEDGLDNWCGVVSPDGITLAWLRARPGVCELVHRPLLGGPTRVLAGCEAGVFTSCPDWSRDGRRLLLEGAAASAPQAHAGLREISFPDGTSHTLTRPPGGARDLMPRYRRDGGVVFWRGDGWGRALHLREADGSERALRSQDYLSFGHAIDAQDRLLLADDSFGQRALVRRDAAGDALLGGSDARYPDIASDGALVYEVARYDANLWRVDLRDAARPPAQLTRSVRYDSQPAYSPDGAWLAFGSNRDGREGAYLMRADGSGERKLPLDPALRWTSPVWSPDGERLLLLRYEGQHARLCVHHVERARTECPAGLTPDRHAAFHLDADTIGVIDAQARPARLWQVALSAPHAETELARDVDRCRANARWLACHRPGRAGLWLRDRASGEVRDVLPELGPDTRGAWALTAGAVYFAARLEDDAAAAVHRFDLENGGVRRISTLAPSAIGDSISVAPDESALVLARTDALETDLVYVPPPQP